MRWISTWLLFSIVVLEFAVNRTRADDRPGAVPPRAHVDGQPLAANLRRVMTTFSMLGTSLDESLSASLGQAIDGREVDRMQELLDSRVLLVVQINPEERVKVRRGPAKVALQQHGFTPVLVKILNESAATKRIRIVSPQGGAVYAGASKGIMQRQQAVDLIENENVGKSKERFLAVEMFDEPPMLDRLSGLEVEYAIALVLSTEAGKREATIGFDLGQGEQDLGFRGETAILFESSPAIPVRLSIRDDDGTATTASLIIRDQRGHIYPLQPKRLAPDFFFQPQIYRADGETVLLPPGNYKVQSGRGPEYLTREYPLKVESPTAVPAIDAAPLLEVRLERWVKPSTYGFYSGDHHIHAAGCAHYTEPTEGVTPEDMFRQVKGEGLNVGCVLTWGPCYRHQRQFFSPKPHNISEPLTLMKYDIEVSGFGSSPLGHVCLLNLQDQTFPGSDGTETKGWPTWTTPLMRWAKSQGAVTGYAHSASGLEIDPNAATKRLLMKFDRDANGGLSKDEASSVLLPEQLAKIDADGDGQLTAEELKISHQRVADQLPNLAIPEMNGAGALEICVTAAEGVCDFISAMDTRRIQEWNTWYHLMNCGFSMKVSGETDFPCMSSRRVGQGRVYVQLHSNKDQADALGRGTRQLDFEEWCTALAKGQSYVSDGFAHALDFRVDGIAPGTSDINLAATGQVTIEATVAFAPETPSTVAQGTFVPPAGLHVVGDTVVLHGPRRESLEKGGERLVEIVFNGRPVAAQKVAANGQAHKLKFQVPVERSGWLALRQFPQLHTNPVNVIVAGKPIRASRSSARWCEQTIELLWKNRENKIAVAERDEARQTFERAKAKYREIASQSDVD